MFLSRNSISGQAAGAVQILDEHEAVGGHGLVHGDDVAVLIQDHDGVLAHGVGGVLQWTFLNVPPFSG